MTDDPRIDIYDPQSMTLGARLQFLFDYVYPAGGAPYTQARVAELASQGSVSVTPMQVHGILSGRTKNPSYATICALSEFFRVPFDFFHTDDPETWRSYVDWVQMMRAKMDSVDLYAQRANRFKKIREEKYRARTGR